MLSSVISICSCVFASQICLQDNAAVSLRIVVAALYTLYCVVLTYCGVSNPSQAAFLIENSAIAAISATATLKHMPGMVLLFSYLFMCSPLQALSMLPSAVAWVRSAGERDSRWKLSATLPMAVTATLYSASYAVKGQAFPFLSEEALAPYTVDASSLYPDMNVTWYLFSSAFLRYIPYFTWLVWLHPLLYAVPLLLRFKDRPQVAFIAQLGLSALFDPSTRYTLVRLPLVALLAWAYTPDVVKEMRGIFIPAAVLHFSLGVAPFMKYLWVGPTLLGNANFLFNHTILVALCGGSLVAEYCLAAMRLKRKRKQEQQSRSD